MVLDLTAIAVRHTREDPLAVVAAHELHLGDAREVLSELVAVLSLLRTALVEPDLLEEVEIRFRTLARPRIACVVEASAIAGPGDASARRPALHTEDRLVAVLSRGDVDQMDVTALRPV